MASLSTADAQAAAAAAAASAEAAGSSPLEEEIARSVKEGKGWKEGEREAYLKKVSDEDHPMFAEIEVRWDETYCGAIAQQQHRALVCCTCTYGPLRTYGSS